MLRVFLEVVLPVALVAIAGGIVGRWRNVPVPPISALVFYLFSPCLVFNSMATTEVSADTSFRILGVMLVTFAVMYAAASAWSFAVRHEPPMRAAYALAATTPNVGNMGLPVALLAFGDAGFDIAVMNFVLGATMVNTLGIAIASMAGGSRAAALRAPFRYPALYAAFGGLVVNALNVDLPTTIRAPIESLAAAAIPVMLTVLGLQLRNAGGRDNLLDTASVNAGRLVIAPIVAWFAATALGLDGIPRATLTVLAAMPTAVIATILATEFRAVPAFVTRIVVTSTLLSMLTLTVLITIVKP
ncbi:MAG: AEC family transporter [Tepidiformaceae bacterium]